MSNLGTTSSWSIASKLEGRNGFLPVRQKLWGRGIMGGPCHMNKEDTPVLV